MKRLSVSAFFLSMLALAWLVAYHPSSRAATTGAVSGQGKMQFRVLYTSDILPPEARAVLKGAHGGFTVDMRPGHGETYFSLKGGGIIRISADLKSTKMIDTPDEVKKTNLHNTQIWHDRNGQSHLMFPDNEGGHVFFTTLDGKLEYTLNAPDASADLGHPTPNAWFMAGEKFIPTDMDHLDGTLYVATGYSKLDYVLTAKLLTNPVRAVWQDLSFGGKGTGVGQFGTGHGITVPTGTKRIDVADRPNAEIDRFTRHGQYISTVKLPAGSYPCDTYYLGAYNVIGSLNHPTDPKTKGAPIYVLENDELISTILPKEELGLANFLHIHNAVMRQINNKYYIIAEAWNPGDFAILEQVVN